MVELMHKFVAWCRIGIFRNKRTRSTQLDPKLMCLVCFVVFGCTWQSFVTTWNSVQNRLNRCNYCTSLCHEVASEFFTMNTPDPPHWTLNSWFGAFDSVWVHFGLFRYYTKVDAKQAEMVELMHKFVPWSRVRIFQNEHTRSTQLNPKLMFWFVS